jgi:hypothetical protein
MQFQVAVAPELSPNCYAANASGGTLEVMVGEKAIVTLTPRYLKCAVTVLGKPAESTPAVDGEDFTADRPGVYLLEVAMGEARGQVRLVAFHREALEHPRLGGPQSSGAQWAALPGSFGPASHEGTNRARMILRSFAISGPVDLIAKTTATDPLPHVPLQQYGAH